jgi:hypothetical protein
MDKLAKTLCCLSLISCSQPCYPEFDFSNFTNYPTPVDDSARQDQIVLQKVYECLQPLNDQWLSANEAQQAECWIKPRIELRSCVKVAVVPDWRLSCDGSEEVFPCEIGPERCLEKGQHPTSQCPCMCRAQIQDATTIWVTPNRKLLAAYAVTIMTGCLSPWTPSLAPCSNIKP